MIMLTRLDERFIHGQVAFAWTNSLGADCILIANDRIMNDKIRQTTLKLATPTGVKLVVRNMEDAIAVLKGDKIKKYKVFLMVDNTKDALTLVKEIPEVKHINLGNMKKTEDREFLTNSIALSCEDLDNITLMVQAGAEVECRAIPQDKKVYPVK